MQPSPPPSPAPKKRRLVWGLFVVLLAAAAAVAYAEGPLWAELSFAAGETFPDDQGWDAKFIRVDIYRNLAKYSPQRLARNLHVPSDRWRGIVCLALRGHPERDPAQWAGVPAALARTAVRANNPGLRKLCFDAFRGAPAYSEEDVRAVLDTLEAHEIPEMRAMVEQIASRSPAADSPWRRTLRDWLAGGSPSRRNVAFQVLVRHDPGADEAAAAQARAVFGNQVDEDKPWALLHQLILRRPALGESLLAGPPEDRRLLWQALAARVERQADEGGLVAAAEQVAVKELAAADGADRTVLIDFLLNRPNGLNLLFRGLEARDDAHVAAVFEKLPTAAEVVQQRRYRPLGEAEAETFVRVLPRLKGAARQRWGNWMAVAGRREFSGRLFPSTAGPNSPRHAATFARLLTDDDSALWVAAYFENVAPLPEAEVGRVVEMLRRGMTSFAGPPLPPAPKQLGPVAAPSPGGGGARAQRGAAMSPQAATAAHFRFAAILQQRFPNHPEASAFFKDFPRVVQELAKNAPPSNARERVNRG